MTFYKQGVEEMESKWFAFAIVPAALAASSSASAFGLDDIEYWFGSGSNRAGFVVQWSMTDSSPRALAWGVRFDGTLNGQTAFERVVQGDARLYALTQQFSFGLAILGIGYDLDGGGVSGTGFTVTQPLPGGADTAFANDPNDRWKSGWNTGFWSLQNASGATPQTWSSSPVGISALNLADSDWIGLAFAPNFASQTIDGIEAAPVPEPTTLAAVAVGLGLMLRRRRKA